MEGLGLVILTVRVTSGTLAVRGTVGYACCQSTGTRIIGDVILLFERNLDDVVWRLDLLVQYSSKLCICRLFRFRID
jgi:hypothetical protein